MQTPHQFANLRIGHLNVRGLERHIDGVKLTLDKQQYHIFGVTETKMRKSAPIGPVKVSGYNYISHTLPSGRGRGTKACGGVGLYVKKGIKTTPIIKSTFSNDHPISKRVEYLVTQLVINGMNIGVAVIYNPSCANDLFVQAYEKLLVDLMEYNLDKLFLIGDFNVKVRMTQPSYNLSSIHRLHNTFNLTILQTPPTRITENTSSTIDLMITDCPQSIRKSATTTANSISDHEIVYLICDVRVPKPVPQRVTYRNLRNFDSLRLQADFQTLDFREVFNSSNIDTKTEIVSQHLQNLLQTHAPERVTVVRDKRTPWITRSIEQAVAARDLAFKLYSRNPNRSRGDPQWNDYCRLRDRANSPIFTAKKRYTERNFSTDRPAKTLWSNLRRDGIHNNSKRNHGDEVADVDQLN